MKPYVHDPVNNTIAPLPDGEKIQAEDIDTSALEGRCSALEGHGTELTARVVTLEEQAEALDELDLGDFITRVRTLEDTTIPALDEQVNDLADKAEVLETETLPALDNRVTTLEEDTSVATLEASLETLTEDVEALQTLTEELASVTSVRGSVDTYAMLPPLADERLGDAWVVESDETREGQSSLYKSVEEDSVRSWSYLGEFKVNLAAYATKAELAGEVEGLEAADQGLRGLLDNKLDTTGTAADSAKLGGLRPQDYQRMPRVVTMAQLNTHDTMLDWIMGHEAGIYALLETGPLKWPDAKEINTDERNLFILDVCNDNGLVTVVPTTGNSPVLSRTWYEQGWTREWEPITSPRKRLLEQVTLYVRHDGNDANDGFRDNPGGALRTVDGVLKRAGELDFNRFSVHIEFGEGDWPAIQIWRPQLVGSLRHERMILSGKGKDLTRFTGSVSIHDTIITVRDATFASLLYIEGAHAFVSNVRFEGRGGSTTPNLQITRKGALYLQNEIEFVGNCTSGLWGGGNSSLFMRTADNVKLIFTDNPTYSTGFMELGGASGGVAFYLGNVTTEGAFTGRILYASHGVRIDARTFNSVKNMLGAAASNPTIWHAGTSCFPGRIQASRGAVRAAGSVEANGSLAANHNFDFASATRVETGVYEIVLSDPEMHNLAIPIATLTHNNAVAAGGSISVSRSDEAIVVRTYDKDGQPINNSFRLAIF